MDKYEVFSALRARGITKAVASFSGGNDEGGVDNITFYDGKEKVELPGDPHHVGRSWGDHVDENGQSFDDDVFVVMVEPRTTVKVTHPFGEREELVYRRATKDEIALHRLYEAIGEPVHAEYGSFAGEFYVHGQVVWDLAARTVTMSKDEQSGYDHHEYAL